MHWTTAVLTLPGKVTAVGVGPDEWQMSGSHKRLR